MSRGAGVRTGRPGAGPIGTGPGRPLFDSLRAEVAKAEKSAKKP